MQFLIEDLVFEDDIKTLISVLKSKKIPYKVFNRNAVHSTYASLDICKEKTFCYGSLEFIRRIKELNNPNLITSCTIENYDCRVYYPHFAAYSRMTFLFNACCEIIKAGNLDSKLDRPQFVRPVVGYKPNGFTGGIYSPKDIDYIKSCFGKNDELLLANTQDIKNEYRIIVSKRKYVTGCTYKTFCKETNRLGFDPSPNVPDSIKAFAKYYLRSVYWEPDDIYVMDIVENDTKICLIEINALSTSGWYDCDYSLIIDEIKETYD